MRKILVAAAAFAVVAACGAAMSNIAMSSGTWTVYDLGDAGMNPAMGITGTVEVKDTGTGTDFKLTVSGLSGKDRDFGAHLHAGDCAPPTSGAGHYQHEARPADAGATDPMWANDVNEVWLDFKTDAMGAATSQKTSAFKVDLTRAKAVVVHLNKTGAGGVAGTKLACIGLTPAK
jgi:superoxide dismutase, Cu-Zn family